MSPTAVTHAVSFLDSWLAYRAKHTDIPGLSVAVLVKDEIIFSRAYGFADVERRIPLTVDHLFNIASQTKMLTGVAILQLAEQRKLSLDEPALTYLPWLADHKDARFQSITIRHLLNHTTGMARSSHNNNYWLFKTSFPTRAQLRRIVLQSPLAFAPGEKVKYSNVGFGLLGLIIENVSKMTFEKYVNTNVLRPLKLPGTALDFKPALANQIPVGYGMSFEGRREPVVPRLSLKSFMPAAGLHASSATMCRFASALFEGNQKILSDTLKQQMFQTQSVVKSGYNEGEAFGLGCMIQLAGERRLVGHDAHTGGHITTTFFDPAGKIAVSVSCNSRNSQQTCILRGIFGVLDFFMQASPSDAFSPFNVRLINELASVQIVHSGNKIVAIDPDDWEPFWWYETLEKVDDKTLQVVTDGSIHNFGELVQYYYQKDKLHHVKFAGITMLPDIS